MKAKVDVTAMFEASGKRAKVQIEIISLLFEKFNKEFEAGWEINLEDAARIMNVKKDSLSRSGTRWS